MLKIGHRGAKGHADENTLDSFQKAIDLGVDMIELDIQLSIDKVPMVIHDTTVDRTTSSIGLVTDYSAKELRKLGIPTLRDVFELVHNQCEINIEIKVFSATQGVLDLIDQNIFDKNKILISSFDWNALQEVRFHDEDIRIGVLTETDLDLALAFAKFIKAYSIHPYYHLITAENIQKIKEKHFKVFPWTINEPTAITFVKSLNVDGIITDFPERL
ncbi:glycerophosphodiester phosphodiesterase family protein [Flavobacterium sp. 102]|uniref:glycerophosphodiester phosphodiesterase n=1 Tax=Flavobacterium sp. 102 TaxID=2135623 RepID=UPI000EB5B604|nr:glycerophosphodiester phosphodiesterase family protein [Flavobacterium sp. 102]RKS01492.1 glycerophosphoryl diester phosphodiesterase [Flavobacterium sp. 102]